MCTKFSEFLDYVQGVKKWQQKNDRQEILFQSWSFHLGSGPYNANVLVSFLKL